MIALTAYAEPQLVTTSAVEPQQVYDPEENSPEEFAQLFAGILQQTEQPQTPEDSQQAFSDMELDFGALTASSKLLFGSEEAIKDTGNLKAAKNEIAQKGLVEEQGNLLRSAELVLETEDTGDFLSKISDLVVSKNLPEAELDSKFFDVDTKKLDSVSQLNAANAKTVSKEDGVKTTETENSGKKEKAVKEGFFAKNENIEAVSAGKRVEENASLQKQNQNKNETVLKTDDLRGRSRKDRVAVEVRDLRTETAGVNNAQGSYRVVETTMSRVGGEAPVKEITLELRLPDVNSASMGQHAAQTSWEARAAGSIENMLARELHQSFNGDIVRHASMMLRNGGEGTIKLALHPDNLGHVKIHLKMAENKITGHIVVESVEALKAFRQELNALEQAFKESGYENADLNLSLAADGFAEGQEQQQDADAFTGRMIASRYEDSYEDGSRMINLFIGQNQGSVNLLA